MSLHHHAQCLVQQQKTMTELRVLWKGNRTRGRMDCAVQGRLAAWIVLRRAGHDWFELRNMRHRTTSLEEIANSAAQKASV